MKFRFQPASDKIFIFAIYAVLWFALIIVSYPLLYVISASFTVPSAVISGNVSIIPLQPTLIAYKAVFASEMLMIGFRNSFIYTSIGTALSVMITMIAAYPLSRKDLAGRNIFMFLFTFTMMFSGGLMPTYLVVRSLKLINTPLALIIPGSLSVYLLILTRTYLRTTIPEELIEATQIDGCSDFRFFSALTLPLSKPIIAVIALMYAVGKWNSYFDALIYLNDPKMFPLQIVLRNILVMNTQDPQMKGAIDVTVEMNSMYLSRLLRYSTIVVASVPVMLIYPFAQKYFIRGIMIGSIKG